MSARHSRPGPSRPQAPRGHTQHSQNNARQLNHIYRSVGSANCFSLYGSCQIIETVGASASVFVVQSGPGGTEGQPLSQTLCTQG